MDLPSHELLLQPRKFNPTESFCEEISQLIFWTNFVKFNVARSNIFPKPVILDCVMLRPWNHSTRLQFPQARVPKLSLWILICMLAFTCNCKPKVELSSFVKSINGKRLRQEEIRATYLASIVDKAISVCSLLFHRTGQLAKQLT